MSARCKSCGQVVNGNHECPKFTESKVVKDFDGLGYGSCPKCGEPFKAKDQHQFHKCGSALHHVVATIKVGVSPTEEAARVFKEISAILEKTSFEVRPRVLKALNEIYCDNK